MSHVAANAKPATGLCAGTSLLRGGAPESPANPAGPIVQGPGRFPMPLSLTGAHLRRADNATVLLFPDGEMDAGLDRDAVDEDLDQMIAWSELRDHHVELVEAAGREAREGLLGDPAADADDDRPR